MLNWYPRWRAGMRLSLVLIIPVLCSRAAAQTIPADYRAFLDAIEAQSAARHEDVVRGLDAVFRTRPESPLNGKAAGLAAQSLMELQRPKDAVAILQRFSAVLPQPEGDLLMGRASESSGNAVAAAGYFQRVYFGFPLTKQAAESETALTRLIASLGSDFPPPMPQAVLDRANTLRKAGQSVKARTELLAAAKQFTGPEKELALVRANYYDYNALAGLTVRSPDADAERIYLMHADARRDSRTEEAEAALSELQGKYPASKWTLEALVSWGNHFLLRNEAASYEPLFRKCYTSFPNDPQGAYCHWKVTWSAWMQRRADARQLMAEHATRFPESEKAAAALYFSGRYRDVLARSPMSYYAVLSREKLNGVGAPAGREDAAMFQPSATTQIRIGRAKDLQRASLPEWAEFELRFAASEQPFVVAMELAEVAASRGAHAQALRYIKSIAKGYLSLPWESAPQRFWKLAFPLPYREPLMESSQREGLDPYLVAALIRQESEFDPNVISRAKAYGLTQVLPSTGRQLSRQTGMRSFSTSMLFQPEVNLRLGTHYLATLWGMHGQRWAETLAAYNAGKRRVDEWSTWYTYREPAEFIETIPFTETRTYVATVLRNADVYRRLYAKQASTVASR